MSNESGKSQSKQDQKRFIQMVIGAAIVAGLLTVAIAALLVNIAQRKQEGLNPFFRVVEITDETIEPEIWGKNFPMQYDAYMQTTDMERTRHGGSEAVPRTPTEADPRSLVARSNLEKDPRLIRMWAGYAFSIDFREARGHAYMLEDQTFTERQTVPQPGTCLNCHASMYTVYKDLGEGDIFAGFEAINQMPYAEAAEHATHPITCIDCHDPDTMALRITRPAFIEGMRVAKAAEGIDDYDVNTMATRQEMRSFVCGQCHVEYYFAGEEKRLTYPWHKGFLADDALEYYDEIEFHDWIHADTGAPMLKAQHPEFETWQQGTHAKAGVSCADCHMPYKRVGAMKISDHHVRSPLLNINNACQTCHKVPEAELEERVYTIQDRHMQMRDLAMDALMDLIDDIVDAMDDGATDEELWEARDYHRKATFLVDFMEAENSMGFHAPQESARVFFLAMDYARKGQMAARSIGTETLATETEAADDEELAEDAEVVDAGFASYVQ